MLTDDEAAAIEARANAATAGPWHAEGTQFSTHESDGDEFTIGEVYSEWQPDVPGEPEPDAAFIAHARADVPALLADRRERIEREARLHDELAAAIRHQTPLGLAEGPHVTEDTMAECPTYYDGCGCTVATLIDNIARADNSERELAAAQAALAQTREALARAIEAEAARIEAGDEGRCVPGGKETT